MYGKEWVEHLEEPYRWYHDISFRVATGVKYVRIYLYRGNETHFVDFAFPPADYPDYSDTSSHRYGDE